MDIYLKGAILETIERAKKLKSKIPVSVLSIYFSPLIQKCNDEIDDIIDELNLTLKNLNNTQNILETSLLTLKEKVTLLDILENRPVAALIRNHDDDNNFNKLVDAIRKEINYPLAPPVVSCLSQEYFMIDTKYNLMSVPLLESDFLLHLPDIYHELGHPLVASSNNSKTDQFTENIKEFNKIVIDYYNDEIVKEKRNGNKHIIDFLENCRDNWISSWSEELFCDLYATYTCGPAFAWSNLHLCAKRGVDPYRFPINTMTDHPSDHSRMKAILNGLDLISFNKEAIEIDSKWQNYLSINPFQKKAEFNRAYPDYLLSNCAIYALTATKGISGTLASPNSTNKIYSLLNKAWDVFFQDTDNYINWESQEIANLKSTL